MGSVKQAGVLLVASVKILIEAPREFRLSNRGTTFTRRRQAVELRVVFFYIAAYHESCLYRKIESICCHCTDFLVVISKDGVLLFLRVWLNIFEFAGILWRFRET
jgi:hypothetical protein